MPHKHRPSSETGTHRENSPLQTNKKTDLALWISVPLTLVVAVGMLYAYANIDLTTPREEVGGHRLLILFAPGLVLASIAFFCTAVADDFPSVWGPASQAVLAMLLGTEIAFLLLSFDVLAKWYACPDNGRLEPLFVAYGVAVTAMEVFRRLVGSRFDIREAAK